MSVYDLTREQLDELKEAYFWSDETQDSIPEYVTFPADIPDDIIFQHYDGFNFVDDDFFCSFLESVPMSIPF